MMEGSILQLSRLSTLKPSFQALNVKKFDVAFTVDPLVAFTVDPLYKQTSAQFDEEGARGLLLNNLGVYAGCRVLFDSYAKPGKGLWSAKDMDRAEVIDISLAKDCVEQMVTRVPNKSDILPTLRDIVGRFNEDNRMPFHLLDYQSISAPNSSCHEKLHEVEDYSFDMIIPSVTRTQLIWMGRHHSWTITFPVLMNLMMRMILMKM